MLITRPVRLWLGTALSMWRAMFLPWRVGFGGWIVAWIVAALGAYLPARWAVRIKPVEALRYE